jgi:hypothetical protein
MWRFGKDQIGYYIVFRNDNKIVKLIWNTFDLFRTNARVGNDIETYICYYLATRSSL